MTSAPGRAAGSGREPIAEDEHAVVYHDREPSVLAGRA